MELIDREYLLIEMGAGCIPIDERGISGVTGDESTIRDYINAAPTIDAVPVVHARWIYKERHRKSYRTYTGFDAAGEEHTITVCQESTGKEPYCSNCGAQAAESFMDYCPKCGAKMDEGVAG